EEKMWRMTATHTGQTPHLVVWPETALSLFDTWDVRRLEENIQRFLPRDALLAAGVMDIELDGDTRERLYFHRISVYEPNGARIVAYDKSHLVPFGEFLPFQEYWPVKPVAFKDGQFTAGKGVDSFALGEHLPQFSPLICYEVLFPGNVARADKRPQFMLNV